MSVRVCLCHPAASPALALLGWEGRSPSPPLGNWELCCAAHSRHKPPSRPGRDHGVLATQRSESQLMRHATFRPISSTRGPGAGAGRNPVDDDPPTAETAVILP